MLEGSSSLLINSWYMFTHATLSCLFGVFNVTQSNRLTSDPRVYYTTIEPRLRLLYIYIYIYISLQERDRERARAGEWESERERRSDGERGRSIQIPI